MIQWKPFEFQGVIYDLTHLYPKSVVYRQAASGDKSEREYRVEVIFSMHCFTRGKKDGEKTDHALLYRDSRECRVFDFRRYQLRNLQNSLKQAELVAQRGPNRG